MRAPNGRHRGPNDRQHLTRNRCYTSGPQRSILNAFAQGGGTAIVATGRRNTSCAPGHVLTRVDLFATIRERGWIAPVSGGTLGQFQLTQAGRLVYQRGWWLPDIGDV